MAKNAIAFLREKLNVPHELTISVQWVDHDLQRFRVFDPTTGDHETVEMQEFHNNILNTYFSAGYAPNKQCLYIRDSFIAPDGTDETTQHTFE